MGSRRFAAGFAVLLATLAAFPWLAQALEQEFYIGLASRVLVFALAATSLNLILGYGGMISFGHAAFFGAGGYAVAILAQHGISSALAAWPAAVLVAAAAAAAIGAISLRTRGLYFIMITLAFAQMVYYVVVSLKAYGGDDGLALAARSALPFGIAAADTRSFYYLVAAIFAAVLYLLHRLAHSRFGRAIQGIRENEARMEALGYPVYRLKLACFVIGGAMAGLAGALAVNQNSFISPNALYWTQSGTLLVMVILGGVGSLYGGLLGAAALLILEEILSGYTLYWQLGLGVVLLAVVLAAPRGLAGMLGGRGGGDG